VLDDEGRSQYSFPHFQDAPKPRRHGTREASGIRARNPCFTAVIEPDEEDSGCVVTFPTIPDLAMQGETIEGARLMAKDCLRGYLGVLLETGRPRVLGAATPRARATIVEFQFPAT
jgi:predicted RNase H-like HicB family nuclease